MTSTDILVESTTTQDRNNCASDADLQPRIGDKLEMYRPLYDTYYTWFAAKEHDDHETIIYDDDGMEIVDFISEKERFASGAVCFPRSASLS